MLRGYSAVLGLYLCWEEGRLRFYDPVAGRYLPTPYESKIEQEERVMAAEQLREQIRRLQSGR